MLSHDMDSHNQKHLKPGVLPLLSISDQLSAQLEVTAVQLVLFLMVLG